MSSNVVFPLPDGPTMKENAPGASFMLTPASASTLVGPSPYVFFAFFTSIISHHISFISHHISFISLTFHFKLLIMYRLYWIHFCCAVCWIVPPKHAKANRQNK